MRRLSLSMLRYAVPCMILLGLTACAFSLGKPHAQIDTNVASVTVHNLDKEPWTDCRFILNANAGEDHQYEFHAGDVGGLETRTVMLPQFSNKDGKRFIPVLTTVSDVAIQCKSPILPLHRSVE